MFSPDVSTPVLPGVVVVSTSKISRFITKSVEMHLTNRCYMRIPNTRVLSGLCGEGRGIRVDGNRHRDWKTECVEVRVVLAGARRGVECPGRTRRVERFVVEGLPG